MKVCTFKSFITVSPFHSGEKEPCRGRQKGDKDVKIGYSRANGSGEEVKPCEGLEGTKCSHRKQLIINEKQLLCEWVKAFLSEKITYVLRARNGA